MFPKVKNVKVEALGRPVFPCRNAPGGYSKRRPALRGVRRAGVVEFLRALALLGDEVKFSARSIVVAVLLAEGAEAHVAGFYGGGEEDALRFGGVLQAAFHHGVAPFLAVLTYVDFKVLDAAVSTVVAAGVYEAFQDLQRAGVEFYTVRLRRQ